MGVVANEPSMEDILSSIKRIIADGSDRVPAGRPSRKRGGATREDDESGFVDSDADQAMPTDPDAVLELTDMVDEGLVDLDEPVAPDMVVTQDAPPRAPASPAPAAVAPDSILSDSSAQAARQSLIQLSSMLIRPQEGEPNTLEGLVREMLRPMLKDWMESHLPELVEGMVKKEIDRIVGRLG